MKKLKETNKLQLTQIQNISREIKIINQLWELS